MTFSLKTFLAPLGTARFWLRQLRGILVAFVAVFILLYVFQRQLIFRAPSMSDTAWRAAVASAFGPQAFVLDPFHAIVVEPSAGQPVRATAILFHGNVGLGGGRGAFASVFTKRGIRLVLAEYPGYGPRAGEPTEASIVADAQTLYAAVLKQYPEAPVMVVGESLGTGAAAKLAADPGPGAAAPSRLVLLTPYQSLAETAARIYWMLPVRYAVKDVFDVEAALRVYQGPVGVLVAAEDEVLGAAQGRALAKQLQSRPTLAYIDLPRAGHNDWRFDISADQWSQLLGAAPEVEPVP